MGLEIDTIQFTQKNFSDYKRHLESESELLAQWFSQNKLSEHGDVGGFELEVWIVDKNFDPLPINKSYLDRLNSDWVSPELSKFNIELNGNPESLHGDALSRLHQTLQQSWDHCYRVAQDFDASLVMIGTLPSVRDDQLVLDNMSDMKRYFALNQQVFEQRKGRPLKLDIVGREHLQATHYDVMLEAATTSFQLHWQMPLSESVRAYNASVIASAATVAVSANSPYLFGKNLWDETRIPLFEQSVSVGGFDGAAFGPVRRVSFGTGYIRESLMENFKENLEHFPIMLPVAYDSEDEEMNYLRLHNGTIWRWNRPLLGFDDDDTPHVRIEHRVITAGPTIIDGIANAAFYYGLAHYLSKQDVVPEQLLDFATARDNFYASAKYGLNAHVTWFDDQKGLMKQLLKQKLIAAAEHGLNSLDISKQDINLYMGIIRERVENEQNGAQWQRNYMQKHQCSMQELTAAYASRQQTGAPVHEWDLGGC